jgi:hypothetical protein
VLERFLENKSTCILCSANIASHIFQLNPYILYIWGRTHLGGNPFDSVLGSTIGPLNVKPFDGPILCGLNGFFNDVDGFYLTTEVQ